MWEGDEEKDPKAGLRNVVVRFRERGGSEES